MKKFKIGLQLYSIREDMEKDMDAALKAVKEMGYECVEFAGFFDKSAEEVKTLLDKYGLEAISVHQTVDPWLKDGQASIDYLKAIGAKYCAIPYCPKNRLCDRDEFESTIKEFTDFGKALKENGMQLLYHNHDLEFVERVDGKFVFDRIFDAIPSDLIRPEIDVCWVKYANIDPCEYIEKYDGMKLLHLKDFTAEKLNTIINDDGGKIKRPTRDENGYTNVPLGCGIVDIPAVIESSEKAGIEYLIVEYDEHKSDRSPLEDVKLSINYLKSLGL